MKKRVFISSLLVLALAVFMAVAVTGCRNQNGDDDDVAVDPPAQTNDNNGNDAADPGDAGDTSDETADTVEPDDPYAYRFGGVMTFQLAMEPSNANTMATSGGNVDGQIRSAFLDPWVKPFPGGGYHPKLVYRWEANEDYTVWTIHVRPGMVWHDGHPITAHDLVWSAELPFHPDLEEIPMRQTGENHERYEIIDDLTFLIITEEPNVSALAPWRFPIPKHIWENVDLSNFSNAPEGRNMIGSGPFVWDEYRIGEFIRFTRFEDYYGGRPYLDELIFYIIPDINAATAALESGQLDIMTVMAGPAEQLIQNPNITTYLTDSGNVLRFYFNTARAPFDDVLVRRAFAHLMDRDTLVSVAMRGFAEVGFSDFSPSDFYHINEPFRQYHFSVERAIELLEEAGFAKNANGLMERDGHVMEYEVMIPPAFADMIVPAVLIMAPTFEQAGIRVTGNVVDAATSASFFTPDNDDFYLLVSGTTMGPNPMRYRYIFAADFNVMRYNSADMHDLFARANAAIDPSEREALFHEIQHALAYDVPNVPLWYRHTIWAHSRDLVVDYGMPAGNIWFFMFDMHRVFKANN